MPVYNREARTQYIGWASDTTVLAASDPSATLAALRDGYTIYVTVISVAITLDAAQTLTFQDSANTPIVIAKVKSSPGIGPIYFEFGEDGTPLTESKAFALLASAAGLAARVHAEGYYKPTATRVPSQI